MQNAIPLNPVEVYRPTEEVTIQKQSSRIFLIMGCIIALICITLTIVLYLVISKYVVPQDGPGTSDNSMVTPTTESNKIRDYSDIQFNENYDIRVLPAGVSEYKRPQIFLLYRIFQLAKTYSWTGDLTDNLGFSYEVFDQEYASLLNEYKLYLDDKKLSPEMHVLLTGTNSELIKSYLIEARSDFISIIEELNFDEKYIQEIEDYVLPNLPERIIYLSDNTTYIGSSTKPISGDYGRRIITIDPRDIDYMYRDLSQTFFGRQLDKTSLIKASAKSVLYHEMGHVLMQAFINQHVTDQVKVMGNSDMWKFVDVDFLSSSMEYFWAWKFNKQISDERIAQGLMIKCLYEKYNLSEEEQEDLYDFIIEKDNYNMNTIQALGEILHDQYDDLLLNNWEGLDDYLLPYFIMNSSTSDEIDLIEKMLNVTEKIPGYVGYFNPASDKDWQFFKR